MEKLIYIFGIIFIFGIYIIFKKFNHKKLNKEKKIYFQNILNKISKEENPKTKIIDYDKLYHKILLEMGYNGSFGEILKQNPKEIININKIWELHKLRNNLVHDFSNFDEKLLKISEKDYKIEIEKIIF